MEDFQKLTESTQALWDQLWQQQINWQKTVGSLLPATQSWTQLMSTLPSSDTWTRINQQSQHYQWFIDAFKPADTNASIDLLQQIESFRTACLQSINQSRDVFEQCAAIWNDNLGAQAQLESNADVATTYNQALHLSERVNTWTLACIEFNQHVHSIILNAFSKLTAAIQDNESAHDIQSLYRLWLESCERAYFEDAHKVEFIRDYTTLMNQSLALWLAWQQQIKSTANMHSQQDTAELQSEITALRAEIEAMRTQINAVSKQITVQARETQYQTVVSKPKAVVKKPKQIKAEE